MKRALGCALFVALGGALATACGLDTQGTFFDLACDGCAPGDGGSNDGVARGSDAPIDPDGAASGDGAVSGDSALDALADGGSGAPCTSAHGPAMVRVAGSGGATFCIDTTEVTNLQYAAFATTNLPITTSQPAECAWNSSFIQSSIPDLIGHGANPAAFVDWCDAAAYCAWAGKRLCGKIGGGPTTSGESDDATASQWYAACTSAGANVYPYAATYASAACIGEKPNGTSDPTSAVPTTTCAAGAKALYDLSGNVAEWSNACLSGTSVDKDLCELRGGGGTDGQAALRCDAFRADKRSTQVKDVGFRCCSL